MKTKWRYSDAKIAEGHLQNVCRMGQGSACCRYLIVAGRSGFICGKVFEDIKETVDTKVAEGTMRATGDNCSGPPKFEVTEETHTA